ncbi:MAG TPA: Lpg1974 family pore-forming outer membrane protein [Chlamydiales bacterium]|nr:Lpg1974 family pore-forming outer membrane protein [Chlamydiales bacterium]
MKKQILKKLFFLPFILAITASAGYGYDSSCDCDDEKAPTPNQGYGKTTTEMMAGYNAPARIDVNGSWDFFVKGSFLYWQAREGGLDLASFYPADPTITTGYVEYINYDFKPGFKVGLGTSFSHDDWTLYLEWGRVHGTSKKHASVDETLYDTHASWYSSGTGEITGLDASWTTKYDMIDLELGRPYYLGTHLTVNPFFGGRFGWLRQKLNVNYNKSAANPFVSKNKSTSWLLGPRAGFDGNWIFGHGFRLIGNAAGSIFYQKIKTAHKDTNSSDVITQRAKVDEGYYNPYAEIGVGLGWGTYFSNNSWHFDAQILWEHHNFWNQNTMRDLAGLFDTLAGGATSRLNGQLGDLSFSGLTASLRLDF